MRQHLKSASKIHDKINKTIIGSVILAILDHNQDKTISDDCKIADSAELKADSMSTIILELFKTSADKVGKIHLQRTSGRYISPFLADEWHMQNWKIECQHSLIADGMQQQLTARIFSFSQHGFHKQPVKIFTRTFRNLETAVIWIRARAHGVKVSVSMTATPPPPPPPAQQKT